MRPYFCLLLLLLSSLPAGAAQLFTGVTHTIDIRPQSQQKLENDFTFTVVPTASKVTIDLETVDPAQDLDLFVQSARPIVNDDEGVVQSDFSSTLGGGDEQIVIDGTTDPPLETGVYYLAILVKTLGAPIRAKLTITVVGGAPPATFTISTFSGDTTEGWERNYPGSSLPGATKGDIVGAIAVDPGNFLRVSDQNGPSQDFAVAPPKFLGNLASFRSGRFEFDYRHSVGPAALFQLEMRIIGAGAAFRWRGPVPPSNEWIHVKVELEESSWTRIAGTASFADVLRQLARIELSMDQAPGAESNDLDNFAFHGEPPPPPDGSPAATSSLFEDGLDNWTRNYPAVGIRGSTTGTPGSSVAISSPGFDSDSFLLLTDEGGSGEDFAVLPDKYLGNLAQLDRPWFEFDYRKISGEFSQFPLQVRVIGRNTVYVWSGARPRTSWEHFRVPLDKAYFVKFDGEAAFNDVLTNVERIELSMDVASGPEVNGLDNFHLRTQFTPPAGRALQVNRERIMLTGMSGGAPLPGQPIKIESTGGPLNWTYSVTPASAAWLSLTPASGVTPADAEIIADPGGLTAGEHTASIVIRASEGGVPSRMIEVSLVLDAQTNAPRINAAGVVHAVDANLRLSAGGLASLFGVRLAPGTEAAEFTDGKLPQELLGVEVRVQGPTGGTVYRAALLYVSPEQINFQMPYEVAGLAGVRITVRSAAGESPPEGVVVSPAGPGLFVLMDNRAAVLNQDFSLNTPAQPAPRGSTVMAYLTGVGGVSPALASGTAAPLDPLSFATLPALASIGGVNASVAAVVMVPGYVGLAQANIEIPSDLQAGEHELRIQIGDQQSNGAIASVK